MPADTIELIDLDVAAPPDRRVKLGGRTYRIPGDAPTGWLLQFRQLESSDETDDLVLVERIRDLLVDLFLIRQPDQEDHLVDAFNDFGATRLMPIVGQLYGNPAQDLAEETPPPTKGGTRSGTRRAPSRSRSSKSSAS